MVRIVANQHDVAYVPSARWQMTHRAGIVRGAGRPIGAADGPYARATCIYRAIAAQLCIERNRQSVARPPPSYAAPALSDAKGGGNVQAYENGKPSMHTW